MLTYDGNKERYSKLTSYGYCILQEEVEVNLQYEIKYPAFN